MSRKKNKIPKGWTDYLPFGGKVEGTKLFPFKTPLKLELQSKIPKFDRFTPACLMANMSNLKAVIDLTDTLTSDRYYNPQDFVDAKVDHLKMRICGGGLVPGMDKIREFSDAVDGFLKKYADDPDALIGVHCTHGLNRTGYFICMYMVNRMGCGPVDAINRFQKARGYEINRQNFLEEIMQPGRHSGGLQKPNYGTESKSVIRVGTYSYKNEWLEVSGKKPFRGFTESETKNRGVKRFNRDRSRRKGNDLDGIDEFGLHANAKSRFEMSHVRTNPEPGRDFFPVFAPGKPVLGGFEESFPMQRGGPSRFPPGWNDYQERMDYPTNIRHCPPRPIHELSVEFDQTLPSSRVGGAGCSYVERNFEESGGSDSWTEVRSRRKKYVNNTNDNPQSRTQRERRGDPGYHRSGSRRTGVSGREGGCNRK